MPVVASLPMRGLTNIATRLETIEYIVGRVTGAVPISARKMFGEYALYVDEKLIALVCDDQLFIKPTDAGRMFIGDVVEAPPYKGAKLSFLIASDQLKDGEWLAELMLRTARALPLLVKRRRKH